MDKFPGFLRLSTGKRPSPHLTPVVDRGRRDLFLLLLTLDRGLPKVK